MSAPELPPGIGLRHDLRPGDADRIVAFHGAVYAEEHGFDTTFETYVAGPLGEFVARRGDRDRLWIAERGGRLAGCIAIVGVSPEEAQLRWYLVDAAERGAGLGTRLLREAVDFARRKGYRSVYLWSVAALTAAARRYEAAGFRLTEERPGTRWGVAVREQRYQLDL